MAPRDEPTEVVLVPPRAGLPGGGEGGVTLGLQHGTEAERPGYQVLAARGRLLMQPPDARPHGVSVTRIQLVCCQQVAYFGLVLAVGLEKE